MPAEKIDYLFIRVDGIGDLVLTLPVDQNPFFKGKKIHWMINEGLDFVVEHADPPRQFSTLQKKFSFKQFISLYRWLLKHRPETAFVFYAPWWVGLALFCTGIQKRIGRRSQWHSFLFFNKSLRQKRSLSEKHELEYNLEITNLVMEQKLQADIYLRLLSPQATNTINKWQLTPQKYFVVHPGMAGSALNWPKTHYLQLIEELAREYHVVITGTIQDRSILNYLKEKISHPQVIWLDEKLTGSELIDVLSGARAVVAPSTGVAHLAASLGVPIVGIYSPRQAEKSTRWGPRGPKVDVLEPTVQSTENLGPEVMNQITVDKVLLSVLSFER